MKLKNYLLLIITFFALCAMKCKKEDNLDPNGLPKATQTGAMVFACKVNGENWISSKSVHNMNGGILENKLFVIGSPKTEDYFENISITLYDNFVQGQTYELNDISKATAQFSTNKTCKGYGGRSVTHSDSISGTVTLTKVDVNNKIISGYFNCVFQIPDCDPINVTEGRFDIRY